ncbi:MAG: hypothetical protein HFK10_00115 [Clostridia bacterium]|nr:hypothetical protein [Clostridia bacterium]
MRDAVSSTALRTIKAIDRSSDQNKSSGRGYKRTMRAVKQADTISSIALTTATDAETVSHAIFFRLNTPFLSNN